MLPSKSRPRPARHLAAILLGLSLGAVGISAAQSAMPTLPNPPAGSGLLQNSPLAPKPLSASEAKSLRSIFTKSRPGSLRLEQCPVKGSCVAPDGEPDGLGSGFVIESGKNGTLALTAYHVVFGAKNLVAVTADKTRYPATVVAYDDSHDVALLKINVPAGRTLAVLPIAAEMPKVGQSALAIGNGGGEFLVSKTGRLTALDVAASRANFPSGTLELTAPLVPGDSGGPILNAQGEVMGIVSYISARATPFGIATQSSYAVPVTKASPLLSELRSGVKVDAPVIGLLSFGDIADEYFEPLGLGKLPGAVFTSVTKGSPADQAGLKPLKPLTSDEYGTPTRLSGDVITAINGVRIRNFDELLSAVRARKVGDTIKLSVVRDGKAIPDLSLKLGPRTITAEEQR
ncbi:PDZ domain-containing protein [Deinococcus psychrotolerans]|uniref:PDZ domain-containing protein n=1 Tax=Deinococcus psychrotolerans TaxID=2489213 RepID=A0A3G8YLK2_9DEIO|nr:trypsin-like peptidase domain-containing protein [Deinococcus psychrotolerans]AZI43494.1 PDZ domain-containing protein [Deinococcus psychrotolerans]